jgi:hypothetical protein
VTPRGITPGPDPGETAQPQLSAALKGTIRGRAAGNRLLQDPVYEEVRQLPIAGIPIVG